MRIVETTIFTIEPDDNCLNIIDADYKDEYGLVLVQKRHNRFELSVNGTTLYPRLKINYPFVRWIDYKHFLIMNPRTKGEKHNLFIMNIDGEVIRSFYCGDAVQDVAVSKEGIWCSYFDEGVFGEGISTEGLVLFDNTGSPTFQYHTHLPDAPSIADCYAICRGKNTTLWLYPYTDFELIEVNPEKNSFIAHQTPETLHGSQAISIREEYSYFYSPYNKGGALYSWKAGESSFKKIGKLSGTLRGLDTRQKAHFIGIEEKNIKVYTIMNPKEY